MTIKNRICTPMVNALANEIRLKIEDLEVALERADRDKQFTVSQIIRRDRHELSCILEDMVEVYPELAK